MVQHAVVRSARVAVFVDGDNLSHEHAPAIRAHADAAGDPVIRRVYGNIPNLPGWDTTPGFRACHAGTGKNAADLLLAIEAVEIALKGEVDRVVIASSDGDFTHLAQRLRELGLHVTGLGEEKAPERFREACSEFLDLPRKSAPPPLPPLVAKVADFLAENGGSLAIQALNGPMLQRHDIRITAHGFATWRDFLSQYPDHFTCDPRGPNAKVRLRA